MEIPLLLRVAHTLIRQNVRIWYLQQINPFLWFCATVLGMFVKNLQLLVVATGHVLY